MKTMLCVFLAAVLFALVYLITVILHHNRPRCPRCDNKMYYAGEDESDREVWVCSHCGERLLL